MRLKTSSILLAAVAMAVSASAQAEVRITEVMYKGVAGGLGDSDREFFEVTNLGDTAVDVTSWSYNDDATKDPIYFNSLGLTSLAAFESVVFTELSVADFRNYWGLDASVQVFSYGKKSNLNGSDTVNIYSSHTQDAGTLVDSVSLADLVGSGVSLNRPLGATGPVSNTSFLVAGLDDAYGSHFAQGEGSDFANPGSFVPPVAPSVPEPATWALMIGGFGLVGASLRRRKLAFA